jgi:SAM-dependent methyltransferase
VGSEPSFRTDLYKGTAEYYDRFRPPYPPALFADLRARAPISGSGRLLDLACGTGQITFALAGDFSEVWAVDQEDESVDFGRAKAQRLGVSNIEWLAGRAEDIQVLGSFELIAIGNAFQRLRRQVVAERAMSWLAPGGCLALLWGGTPWLGDVSWQQAMADTFEGWMRKVGATDRVPDGWQEVIARDPHPRVLERAGLSFVGSFEFPVEHTWTVQTLTGFVYSTSFLNPNALGNHMQEFERDLHARLIACEPSGVFHQKSSFSYDLARRSS